MRKCGAGPSAPTSPTCGPTTSGSCCARCAPKQRCSRADLAAKTGLNKATVSSLVAELIERRVLRESGSVIGNIGRPAVLLSVDTGYYASLGVEVNVDYMTLVAVDLAGNRLLSWRRAHDGSGSTPGRSVSALAGLAKRAVDKMDAEGRQILGLAVAVPGMIDNDGVVQRAPMLGWSHFDLTGRLRQAMRDPKYAVTADNDANLGAVAEQRFGSWAGVSNMIYLTGEIGLGAGLIVDGELRRGATGFAGEIGNLLIDVDGRVGRVEDLAGISAVLKNCPNRTTSPGPKSRPRSRTWSPAPARARTRACSSPSTASAARSAPASRWRWTCSTPRRWSSAATTRR